MARKNVSRKKKERAIKRIRVYYINKWGEKNIYIIGTRHRGERDIYTRVFLLVTTLL